MNEFTGLKRLWRAHTHREVDMLLKIAEVEWKGWYNREIWNNLSDSQFDEMVQFLERFIDGIKTEKNRHKFGTGFTMAIFQATKGKRATALN